MPASLAPFVGIMLRPLTLPPFRYLPSIVARALAEHHPSMFERLGEHAKKRFGLAPTDLSVAFVLEPNKWPRPRVTMVTSLPPSLDALVSGPIADLIGLIDGSFDGDALFFSRDLVIQGDVEAVLALRNAVDSAEIDFVRDIAAPLGPLARPAELLLRALQRALDGRGSGTRKRVY